jgi:site-specific recombinase XerD
VLGKRSRIRDVPIPPHGCVALTASSTLAQKSAPHAMFLTQLCYNGRHDALSKAGVTNSSKDASRRAVITKRVYPHLRRHPWMTETLRCGMNPIQLSFIADPSPARFGRE